MLVGAWLLVLVTKSIKTDITDINLYTVRHGQGNSQIDKTATSLVAKWMTRRQNQPTSTDCGGI